MAASAGAWRNPRLRRCRSQWASSQVAGYGSRQAVVFARGVGSVVREQLIAGRPPRFIPGAVVVLAGRVEAGNLAPLFLVAGADDPVGADAAVGAFAEDRLAPDEDRRARGRGRDAEQRPGALAD